MTIKQHIKEIYWAEWHEFHICEQKNTEIIPRRNDLLEWLYEEIKEEHIEYWDNSSQQCQEWAEYYGVSYDDGEVVFIDDNNELIADVTTAWQWWESQRDSRMEGMRSYDYRQEVRDGIIHSLLGRLSRDQKQMKSVA